ncbi:BMP family ABC transporter substrate-binding protein [Halalkalibacter urbisdiaboli]|uniref:BMP family ABC transporter substrate-binding protein n=1 Tax=Halalkalibacter urbisdiaboli TaxID=1960589 RepID=UPI000B42DC2E|nr:BMP family ABC transporter substrate-binding protein [Halalkalibacter urbisdiaboli]
MQIHRIQVILLLMVMFVAGCKPVMTTTPSTVTGVGLLLEETIDDRGWNSKGYQGLLNIHSNLGVDVFFKEDVDTLDQVKRAVKEFSEDNISLIFGHGRIFADFFSEIADEYPDIHFVSFNGDVTGNNVTSIHFSSYAMGFFAGMVAAKMSNSGEIGVIAAYSWQPEVKGFQEGAAYGNADSNVHIDYVNEWSNVEKALGLFKKMKADDVDVFYPTGDGYTIKIIEEAKNDGLYAIGYVGNQSDLGEKTVLTSTVQHVDHLYELVAEQYLEGKLEAGNQIYDFQDGVISLGTFSSKVPEPIKHEIEDAVLYYIETGELPKE